MALCQWSLIRAQWPDREARRPRQALGLVPGCAVLPHFETFGERWIPSARRELGEDALLVGIDERSAALWSEGHWRAMGPGAVTVIQRDERRNYADGAEELPLPQPRATPPPADAPSARERSPRSFK
jgi:cyanophycinase-like exopeptidase